MTKGRVLRVYDTRAVFENLDSGSCLVVSQIKEGWTKDLQVCDKSQLAESTGQCQSMPLEAIFGFYDFLSGSYVALVVESEKFVSAGNIDIREAKKILVVPLFRNGRMLSNEKQNDENTYLQLLHSAISQHQFYFSTSYDITHSQQRIAQLTPRQLSEPLWSRANNKFFWNREVVLDMIACQADDWIVPFMSAYIEYRPGCEADSDKFGILFISRRSRFRQGCRFTKRGLDDLGHAANYVETEQVLLFPDGKITSFIQIRGSIPVAWCSPVHMRYDPAVTIDSDPKAVTWCAKHMDDITNDHSQSSDFKIICVNLIDHKKDQNKLGIAFETMIQAVNEKVTPPVQYIWFDFHAECKKKGKWSNLSKLLQMIEADILKHEFFCKMPNGAVTSWQKGIIRTNCMDNLDRTNVVQSIFARRSLLQQLNKTSDNVLATPFPKLEAIYKTIWVNNANAMSLLYAGTGALKVDFTKTGKRTIKGMFDDACNSCMRYYLNNFTDGVRQDAIDVMLGNYRPDVSAPSPFVPREGQETLEQAIIKAFVLLILIFSCLLVLPTAHQAKPNLCRYLLISVNTTLAIMGYIAYRVMIKGSKIGERLVVHPSLMPDNIVQAAGRNI